MSHRLFGTMLLFEAMLAYCSLGPLEQMAIFIHENEFESIVSNMNESEYRNHVRTMMMNKTLAKLG